MGNMERTRPSRSEYHAETTAHLNIRTAEIIKRIQPEAKIAGLAYTSNSDKEYLDKFLKVIADAGKLDLFNWISYHSYTMRPEDAYTEKRVLGLRSVIEKYSKNPFATGRKRRTLNLYTQFCFVGILLD
jgi:hypothetical protein